MQASLMDEETSQPPDRPVIPPPDIPKPSIPAPSIPPPDIRPADGGTVFTSAPVVNVKIRDAAGEAGGDSLEGSPVPFNTRVLAALIDLVLMIGLQIGAYMILPGFADRMAWLVGPAYWVVRDSLPFLGAQSVGKKAMKIRVLTLEDKTLAGNWEVALIRNGVLLIPFFGLIELYILLTREESAQRGRRLGDEWAKTKVVLAPDPPPADDSPT